MKKFTTTDIGAPEWSGPFFRPCFFGYGHSDPDYPIDDLSRNVLSPGATWIYVLSGGFRIQSQSNTFEISEGESLLYSTPGNFSLLFPENLTRLQVGLYGPPMAKVAEHLTETFGNVHRLAKKSPPVVTAGKLCKEAQQQPLRTAHEWSLKLYEWFLLLWQELDNAPERHRPEVELKKSTDVLGTFHPSFKSLAAKMGYEPAYLSRSIKKSWGGKSPAKILRLGRLEEAEKLLRMTNLSIREISQKVCYASPESFSTAFRTLYGQPPLRYRHESRFGAEHGLHSVPETRIEQKPRKQQRRR